MNLVYLIIYISIFLILFKVMYIGLFLLFTFIIGKVIKFNEEKWEYIFSKIRFKGFMIFIFSIYLINIILISILSKITWNLIASRFKEYMFFEKVYLLIPLMLIIKLIYKILFKRDELITMARKFNDKIETSM